MDITMTSFNLVTSPHLLIGCLQYIPFNIIFISDQSKKRVHKRTSTRSHASSTCEAATSTAVTNSSTPSQTKRVNGIVAPPTTYQRQLHHRVATRAAANAGTTTRQSVGVAKTKPMAPSRDKERGREGEGKGVDERSSSSSSNDRAEVISLCPLHHKVTEVCTACLAR